jgi:2-keto-3-deoxy-6-phosphogluconate aldolase
LLAYGLLTVTSISSVALGFASIIAVALIVVGPSNSLVVANGPAVHVSPSIVAVVNVEARRTLIPVMPGTFTVPETIRSSPDTVAPSSGLRM